MKHGMKYSRLYGIWCNMKSRCYNRKTSNYRLYGGKGVTVCDEWLSDFVAFMNWSMANGYADNLTIDRINPNGNYSPDNCRWTTQKVQCNHFSRNRMITYKDKTQSLTMWCEELSLPYSMIKRRLYKGESIENAFERPKVTPKKILFNGIALTVREWSIKTKIPERVIHERIRHNWPIERVLTTPKMQ